MNDKKSFILYFDALPLFSMLPVEQRGWLISALFDYARAVAEDPETGWEEIAERFPEMEEGARFVLQYMCSSVERDTKKWRQQRDARVRRQEEKRRQEEGERWKDL